MARCEVCFRKCEIKEGEYGFCGVRTCLDGRVKAANYGVVTSLALDPIEKKPLYRFYPGSRVLSVGSYGCNLRCPFCQNHDISWSERALALRDGEDEAERIAPQALVELALNCRIKGNIGLAFTYNEPLVGYEFVRDTAMLAHEAGLMNVLVTNGTASAKVFSELSPWIDAMNIDLKSYSDRFYSELIKGRREMTLGFIEEAVKSCHVELTTLIIPGENDSEEEMRKLSGYVADLQAATGRDIPLHITRFFPRFHMTDRAATDINKLRRLGEIARERLPFVYLGNI